MIQRHPLRTLSARALSTVAGVAVLAACGGGGGSSSSAPTTPQTVAPAPTTTSNIPAVPQFTANAFPRSSTLRNLCRTVRTDRDLNGNPRPDRQGELGHELFWLRSWMNETYLFFDQVTDTDPTGFTDVEAYFDERLTTATTLDNQPVDRFSFVQTTESFEDRTSGAPVFGYGVEFARLRTNTFPRDWRVAFTQEGGPAETAGLTRGARILRIDGVDFLNGTSDAEVDTILDGLFPDTIGESHTFDIERPDGTQDSVTLSSASVTIEPVNDVRILQDGDRQVGYLHYTSFSPRTGEQQLLDAFTTLSNAGVDDLVLDFRYNGGGLLFLAAQIGYMVAGPTSTDRVFYAQEFNSRSPNVNPVNGNPVTPIPFVDETVGFSVDAGRDLPSVDLPRVFILTTSRSCSASEAVMNGLMGIGVEVVQIGTRTCGKATGQIPTENCGLTFSPLHFRGVNAAGFGDFDTGFAPGQMTGSAGPVIPGCRVEDDFANPLGDPDEALLSAALAYARTGECPAVATTANANANTKADRPLAQIYTSGDDPLMETAQMRALDAAFGTLDMSGTSGAETE